jgi:flagellar basal-body rod protein FlgB
MLDQTGLLLERYLDLLAARQRVTASNIANADTPGYRAREIDFGWHMRAQLASGREPHLPIAVRESWGEGAKNDGNNVQLDRELMALAGNSLRFNVASVLLQHQIRNLRSAIHEGRTG